MSPKEESKPIVENGSENSTEGQEQVPVRIGKKPFIEPTLSISLNILDATAFFQGSAALDAVDVQ
jgi:hypothetical protein